MIVFFYYKYLGILEQDNGTAGSVALNEYGGILLNNKFFLKSHLE